MTTPPCVHRLPRVVATAQGQVNCRKYQMLILVCPEKCRGRKPPKSSEQMSL